MVSSSFTWLPLGFSHSAPLAVPPYDLYSHCSKTQHMGLPRPQTLIHICLPLPSQFLLGFSIPRKGLPLLMSLFWGLPWELLWPSAPTLQQPLAYLLFALPSQWWGLGISWSCSWPQRLTQRWFSGIIYWKTFRYESGRLDPSKQTIQLFRTHLGSLVRAGMASNVLLEL